MNIAIKATRRAQEAQALKVFESEGQRASFQAGFIDGYKGMYLMDPNIRKQHEQHWLEGNTAGAEARCKDERSDK